LSAYEKIITRLYKGIEFEKDRDPDNKGIKGFVKRRLSKRKSPSANISIVLNNKCNLNCFACSVKPNTDRYETSAEEVNKFLNNIKRWKPNSGVIFSGGEITLMKPEKLQDIFIACRWHNRKVIVLTNGARKIDLKYVDHVILDNHGKNEKAVLDFEQLLIKEEKPYTMRKTIWHRDNEAVRGRSITKGARCHYWLDSISLWKKAVYPCCVSCNLDSWDEDNKLRKALLKAGWSYSNILLSDYIENWRNTLPPIMFKKCMLSCWTDAENNQWGKIY
jgi:organic radical activating enzyme